MDFVFNKAGSIPQTSANSLCLDDFRAIVWDRHASAEKPWLKREIIFDSLL